MPHTGAALLGLAAFLLAVAAIASYLGYLPAASFDGFTTATWGFFTVLAFMAACGVYYVEDRRYSPPARRGG